MILPEIKYGNDDQINILIASFLKSSTENIKKKLNNKVKIKINISDIDTDVKKADLYKLYQKLYYLLTTKTILTTKCASEMVHELDPVTAQFLYLYLGKPSILNQSMYDKIQEYAKNLKQEKD